jgi:hypothetical protein
MQFYGELFFSPLKEQRTQKAWLGELRSLGRIIMEHWVVRALVRRWQNGSSNLQLRRSY